MKFTKSGDGVLRASVKVAQRIGKTELEAGLCLAAYMGNLPDIAKATRADAEHRARELLADHGTEWSISLVHLWEGEAGKEAWHEDEAEKRIRELWPALYEDDAA